MKKTPFKFLLFITILCLTLVSCGDDNDKKANEMIIDEVSVGAGNVFLSQGMEGIGNSDGYALVVTSSGISTFKTENNSDDFEGSGHVLFFYFKNDIVAPLKTGTYTFDSEGVSPAFTWGQMNVIVNDVYSTYALVKSGTVKISKSGSRYTITYNLIVEWDETETQTTVTGYYSGKLKPAHILF